MNSRIVSVLAWASFVAALAWTVILLTALGQIYLTHDFPNGFFDWVIDIQSRGTDVWLVPVHHTATYYLARFFVFTFVVEALGIWSYLHLRHRAGRRALKRTD